MEDENYEWRRDESDDVRVCETCQCAAPLESFFDPESQKGHGMRNIWLCEVCASTECGIFIRRNRSDLRKIATMIAQCTNLVLRKMEK